MADHFERAMQAIALRKNENGGLKLDDVLTALVATNEDLDGNHIETRRLLSEHIKSDKARVKEEARNLSAWQKGQASACAEQHRVVISEEFAHHGGDTDAQRAAIVADAVKAAAVEAARIVAETAQKTATAREHSAEDAAGVLVAAADEKPKRFTREQLVANFWILVGLLAVGGVVNGLIDLLFNH